MAFSMRVWRALASWAAFACCAAAHATTYVMPTDATLADSAHGVLIGDVLGVEPGASAAETVWRIATVRVLSRGTAAPVERVLLPGGASPDGRVAWMPGVAWLAPGSRVLIFYERRLDGTMLPLHLNLGLFYRSGLGGDATYVRALDGSGDVGKRNAEYHAPRSAERFEAWIAARSRGAKRAPDYLVPNALPQPLPKFVLLTAGNGRPVRWNEFDTDTPVTWHALSGGQVGMIRDPYVLLQQAFAAWNDDPASRILLSYGGFAGGIDTFCDDAVSDGNVVLWNDPLGTIGGTFTCGGGGTIATAGPCATGGDPFNPIVEARLTVQDGAGCYLDRDGGLSGAEALTHELGHTLGFAHSCENGGCPFGSDLDDATLRWLLHDDGRGAVLRADDRAAAFAVYPNVLFRDGFE